MDECTHYKIVRFYFDRRSSRAIRRGLTLTEAQTHCKDPETSSTTAKSAKARQRTRMWGKWFDGYEKE